MGFRRGGGGDSGGGGEAATGSGGAGGEAAARARVCKGARGGWAVDAPGSRLKKAGPRCPGRVRPGVGYTLKKQSNVQKKKEKKY